MTTELVRCPVFTAKSDKMMKARNQYSFDVDLRLTKPQIKRLVEELFQVRVERVNTHLLAPKKRRVGGKEGVRRASKRAIVTVQKGQAIPILPSEEENPSPLSGE